MFIIEIMIWCYIQLCQLKWLKQQSQLKVILASSFLALSKKEKFI